MKGTVERIPDPEAGDKIVTLRTEYGILAGRWSGALPAVGTEVFVELEFDPVAEPVPAAEEHSQAVSPVPGEILLTGQVEAWNEGVLDLRVGDSVVRVELGQAHPSGRWLTVRGRDLVFFDANL